MNSIRKDITQESRNENENSVVSIMVGDRNKTYNEVVKICHNELITSLSRDNITSNAMKMNLEEKNFDRKLLEKFEENDNNSTRKHHIITLIKAVELARNTKYKDALKIIDSIYKNNSKKSSLFSLINMINEYEVYCDATLFDFYNVACNNLDVKLPKIRKRNIKDFYEETLYRETALCVNIVEDASNHTTIHKAKGAEFENVFVIGNKDALSLLLQPDLMGNEEHRVFYVAMSRAKNKLFLQFDNLDNDTESILKNKYNIEVKRF